MKKISKRIVDCQVVGAAPPAAREMADIGQMHDALKRPDMLWGATYKIKTPLSGHALYITINDLVLNEGSEHELRRPYEIFINSKNMEHYQWVVALTLLISAVFRKGGDLGFIVEELRAVFDPQGGYYKPGGKFMPSLVAEIGDTIEHHLQLIGMHKKHSPDPYQQAMLDEQLARYTAGQGDSETAPGGFPANALLCKKCLTRAAIMMDGCLTCLNCGAAKCG